VSANHEAQSIISQSLSSPGMTTHDLLNVPSTMEMSLSTSIRDATIFSSSLVAVNMDTAKRGPIVRIFCPSGEHRIRVVMAILYRSGSCLDRGKAARGGSNFGFGARGDDARGKCIGIGVYAGVGGSEEVGAGPMVNCGGAWSLRRRCRCSL